LWFTGVDQGRDASSGMYALVGAERWGWAGPGHRRATNEQLGSLGSVDIEMRGGEWQSQALIYLTV